MKYLLILLTALSLTSCSIVGPGERGIRTNFGAVSTTILEPGIHLWFPLIMGLTTMDVQIQKSEIKTDAASKDMQDVLTVFALNWHLQPDKVAAIYQQVGTNWYVLENIISPAISEVLKAATAKKTAEEILTKRHELKVEIDKDIKTRMSVYGIVIDEINITNITFSKDFAHAVEQKQIAEQRAKQAEYEAVRAEKDAVAEVNKARGQSEAQRLLQKTLTKDVLMLEYLKRWDGKLPSVLTGGGNGGGVMFNMHMGGKNE